MKSRKGFHLSVNVVITLVIGAVLVALLIGISTGIFNEGQTQILDLAGI